MDTKRILYFLNLLNMETTGRTDELADIYRRALDENDDVTHLKLLLDPNEYIYYREPGRRLYQLGAEAMKAVYSHPSKVLEALQTLKQTCELIEKYVEGGSELMRSPWPFTDNISVLKKKDTAAYRLVLRQIASTSVYLMLLYDGLDAVKDLTWDDSAGLQEMIHAVNTGFLPALCRVRKPEQCWVITRRMSGGETLFGGAYFCLSYENAETFRRNCSIMHKESMGTHAYLNTDAYEYDECDVPFCWGTGNIVSASPDTALLFLQRSAAVEVRSPQGAELLRKMPVPTECIRELADGELFCITPDELLRTMNQWQTGHEIEKRKKTGRCLFCGNYVNGNGLICPSHFTSGVD